MNLRDYLSFRKISGSSLAREIGVTPAALRFWVRRERMPRMRQMAKIMRITNGAVQPNDFLPDDKEAAE